MSSSQTSGNQKLNRARRIFLYLLSGLVVLAVLSLVLGIFIQLLWNATIAVIFEVPAISYWQGVGLFILARLLFGFRIGRGGRYWGYRRRKYQKESGDKQPTESTEKADESSG